MTGGLLSRGVTVQVGSLSRGSLSRGVFSVHWGLCPGGIDLCPVGSLSRVSVQGESLSKGVSVRETPLDKGPLYGNERAIRILLEGILVSTGVLKHNFVIVISCLRLEYLGRQ